MSLPSTSNMYTYERTGLAYGLASWLACGWVTVVMAACLHVVVVGWLSGWLPCEWLTYM